MSSTVRRSYLPALLLLLLAFGFGCGDDGVAPHDEDPPDTIDNSPADLANLFTTAMNDRDGDAYEAFLHPHFQFIFLQGEGPMDSWGKADDVASMRNLFSGDPPPMPDDATQNRGISSIEVARMVEVEPWAPVLTTDPLWGDLAGARKAVYDLRIVLMHDDGAITLDNSQILCAAPTVAAGSPTRPGR